MQSDQTPFYAGAAKTVKPGGWSPEARMLFAVILVLAGAAGGILGGSCCFLLRMSETLPTLSELENIQQPLVSKVVASDSSVVYEFSTERRFWVSLDKIPPDLVHAVIATEDRRFFAHWGINAKRILGAALVDVISREYAQGASTITQQLARNLYLTARQTMTRKIREVLTAVQIERHYTKKEILELYLNQVYLGAGTYGVEAASQRYFSKPVSELNLAQCATVAGMIQLPERYRPDIERNIPAVTARRNTVLRAMRSMRFAGRQDVLAAEAVPVRAEPREAAVNYAPYFIDMVRQYVTQKYGEDLLYGGGLTIYTTLDPLGQDSAEAAAARHLRVLQARLNRMCVDSSFMYRTLGIPRDTLIKYFDSLYAANKPAFSHLPDSTRLRLAQVSVVAIDVRTGAIRTMIGGRSFTESKYNRALLACRQPGSAFKPFVYTAAIDSQYTPVSVILDQPVTLETPTGVWRPENFDREFSGPVTLRRALYKSLNLPAIQVHMQIGPQSTVNCARRMGITTPLSPVASLAIGACEVIPAEIIAAYAVFANGGYLVKPYAIEKIVDKHGKVLEERVSVGGSRVLPASIAYIMTSMLSDVVRRGTAAAIPGLGFTRPAAGKTGTTNDYSDAWFIGFTPQIVCGVWVGVDERRSLGRGVTGSEGAVPIWVPAMQGLHQHLKTVNFARPDSVEIRPVCVKSNKLAGKFCPQTADEVFVKGREPPVCDVHRPGGRRGEGEAFGGSSHQVRPDKQRSRPLSF